MTWPQAGERIRALRQLLAISQEDLAAAAGVSQSYVSHVEKGLRYASDDLISAVAAATATPRKFFEVTPVDIPATTLRFRKLASTRRSDTKRINALFVEAIRVVGDILANSHYPTPNLPIATGDVDDDDIEHLAKLARDALQLSADSPIRHLIRACERAGVAVAPLTIPGDHDTDEGLVGHFGISHWWGADEPGLIGYFSGGSGDRQRFTIAHELAHLILHTRRRTVRDHESEANRLAGAILLPYDRAIEVLSRAATLRDLTAVKARWGISIQALIMRGSHLGLIDERRKVSLFKQLSARGWRKKEPGVVHFEEPQLVWRLLARQYGNPVPYQYAANDVGINAVILRSIAPAPAPATPNPPKPNRDIGTVRRLRPA